MSKYIEFRYGWPVVVSSALGIALGMSPLPFYTIGVFAGPLMAEFGWSISQVMSALAVFTVVAMVTSPLVGYLTDRIGVRKVVLTPIVLFSLSLMAFALNNGSITRYLLIWGIMSVCGTGTLLAVCGKPDYRLSALQPVGRPVARSTQAPGHRVDVITS